MSDDQRAAYSRAMTRRNPGCFLFLVDQSDSMNQLIEGRGSVSKAHVLADALNDLFTNMIRQCVKERNRPPRHFFDIGVLGYAGEAAYNLLGTFSGSLDGLRLISPEQLAQSTIGTEQRHGATLPVWVRPFGAGRTPMCGAFNLAGQLAHAWVKAHPDSFPPIIINITDGQPTDGEPGADAEVWARRLTSLRTQDGNLLLFNIHVSASGHPGVAFVADEHQLASPAARMLFRMSSELPEVMRQAAMVRHHRQIEPGARGFAYNTSIDDVAFMLNIGTQILAPDSY
jgi:hypothetical protein